MRMSCFCCQGGKGRNDSNQGETSPTAVIEISTAAGLTLIPPQKRNPLHTTTFGVGQIILDALDHNCRNFIIGIGGSATTDCGTGMAQALGVRVYTIGAGTTGFAPKAH